jgi:predicted alpha/beta hydrolase family esterase
MNATGRKGQVLFIQGAGTDTHDTWDDKLVDSLRRELGDGREVRYPRMPNEDDPTVATWSAAIRREVADLDDGAVVVGHSVGAAILIHVLAQQPPAGRLAGVVLIAAPFVGDGGWPADEFELPSDLGAKLPHGLAVDVFHGLGDETVPPSHADLYARAIPQARLHLLSGRDHQLGNDLREVAELIRAGEPGSR